jgi:WD40 repeat protein
MKLAKLFVVLPFMLAIACGDSETTGGGGAGATAGGGTGGTAGGGTGGTGGGGMGGAMGGMGGAMGGMGGAMGGMGGAMGGMGGSMGGMGGAMGGMGGAMGGMGGMMAAAPIAVWQGDFNVNGSEEVAVYDGSMSAPLVISGVTTIDNVDAVAVSPDGTQVAVGLSHDGGLPRLYITNLDGSGTPIQIVEGASSAVNFGNLAWSSDGSWIAFTSDPLLDGENLVYAAPSDASALPKLVSQDPNNAAQDASAVAWVDATHVVYRGDLVVDTVDNFYVSDIGLVAPAPVPLIPENLVIDGQEAASQAEVAGGKIYFRSSHEGGAFKLYRVDPDGMNLEQVAGFSTLTNGSGAAQAGNFALSPDGTMIAFSADSPTANLYQIYVAPVAGAATLQSNVTTTAPVAGITGPDFFSAISWSPDGLSLAVVADWPVVLGDADNDFAGFIVPASGAAGGVNQLLFSADGTRLLARGDLIANNDTQVYGTTDLTTADQSGAATLLQDVPAGGDVFDLLIVP